jgi:hypothetical protein
MKIFQNVTVISDNITGNLTHNWKLESKDDNIPTNYSEITFQSQLQAE